MSSGKPIVGAKLLFLLLIPLPFSHAASTLVTVSGRKLLVSGQPYTIKGVDYSPYPVGTTAGGNSSGCTGPYLWWTDRPTYIADFSLIKAMGANTIRAYGILNDTSPSMILQVRAALDAAAAQNLHVIMNFYPSHTALISASSAAWHAQFVDAVNAYKDHPAVLLWEFGNEQNLDNGQDPNWYAVVDSAAAAAKVIDANHPVMTVEGECAVGCPNSPLTFSIGQAIRGALDSNVPNVDIWGINIYRGPTFQGAFEFLASTTTKPILVTEFGKDAWHDSLSAEDQDMQASHLNSQWQEINSNLSASGTGSQNLIGGVLFEWTDEWWKDSNNDCLTHGHDVLFSISADAADPNYQNEWFGVAAVSPVDAVSNPGGTNRTLRKGYSTLQTFWNPGAAATSGSSASSFFSETVRNYPNPFQLGPGSTKFVVLASQAGTVDVRIYDAGGQFITSFSRTVAGPGRLEIVWDGHNGQGSLVSPGLYIAKIHGNGASHEETQYRRVVGVK